MQAPTQSSDSIEARLAHLEGIVEQLEARMTSLENRMTALEASMRQGFFWIVGIQVTTLLTLGSLILVKLG